MEQALLDDMQAVFSSCEPRPIGFISFPDGSRPPVAVFIRKPKNDIPGLEEISRYDYEAPLSSLLPSKKTTVN